MSGVEKGTVKGAVKGATPGCRTRTICRLILAPSCWGCAIVFHCWWCPSGRRCITRNDVWCKANGGSNPSTTAPTKPVEFVSAGFLHAWIVLGCCWRVCWWVFVQGTSPSFYRLCATSGALPVLADLGVGKIVLCVLRFLTTRWSHKISVLRDKNTPSPIFRQLVDELVTLLAYEGDSARFVWKRLRL